jgi:hypothetical protein
VIVALGIQYAMRMRHIVICGVSGSSIFFYIISQTLLNVKYVILFSLQMLPETFLIPRRMERDRSRMHIGRHVQ